MLFPTRNFIPPMILGSAILFTEGEFFNIPSIFCEREFSSSSPNLVAVIISTLLTPK